HDTFDEITEYIRGNVKCHYIQFAGCILVHAISNIRNWNIFPPTDLEKLYKKDIPKPNPEISTHTTPCSDWEISIPNAARKFLFIKMCQYLFIQIVIKFILDLNPTCLNKRNLIKELNLRGIEATEKENRSTLVLNLEIQLENDIKNAKLDRDISPGVLVEKTNISNDRYDENV
ncbi:5108_t:CDS:2, partial [Gigaspora rosea]